MIGPFERRPFYWLDYRLSEVADAEWHHGRVMVTGDKLWLYLELQDAAVAQFPSLSVLLDPENLTQRYDESRYSDTHGGGTYFVHQGVLREKNAPALKVR